jgi:hypothetical protein
MKVKNHTNFAFTNYNQASQERLGEIVKKVNDGKTEIGVIIQNHGDGEYRIDTWGNDYFTEFKLATRKDIEKYRPELIEHLTQDRPLFDWSKNL